MTQQSPPDPLIKALDRVADQLASVHDVACAFQAEVRDLDRKRVRQVFVLLGATLLLIMLQLIIAWGNRRVAKAVASLVEMALNGERP